MSKAYLVEVPFRPWQLIVVLEASFMFRQNEPLQENQLQSIEAFFKILSHALMKYEPTLMAKACVTVDRIHAGDYNIPQNFFDIDLTDIDDIKNRLAFYESLEVMAKHNKTEAADATPKTPRQTH